MDAFDARGPRTPDDDRKPDVSISNRAYREEDSNSDEFGPLAPPFFFTKEKRYYPKSNSNYTRWTDEEHAKLEVLVRDSGFPDGGVDWVQVAIALGNDRSASACWNRWERTHSNILSRSRSRSRFDESATPSEAFASPEVEKGQVEYKRISDSYTNAATRWTTAELQRLEATVLKIQAATGRQHPKEADWAEVAKRFGRTSAAVRIQWLKIVRSKEKVKQQAVETPVHKRHGPPSDRQCWRPRVLTGLLSAEFYEWSSAEDTKLKNLKASGDGDSDSDGEERQARRRRIPSQDVKPDRSLAGTRKRVRLVFTRDAVVALIFLFKQSPSALIDSKPRTKPRSSHAHDFAPSSSQRCGFSPEALPPRASTSSLTANDREELQIRKQLRASDNLDAREKKWLKASYYTYVLLKSFGWLTMAYVIKDRLEELEFARYCREDGAPLL
ncbi:hypothetical protein P7C70_g3508, partial [Phenoliferia sp. Uapishka_3]